MRAILEDNPETAVCWLASAQDEILGRSLLCWFPPDIFGRTCSYISVFVDPLNRGNGLGRQLVAEAVSYAQHHAMKPWFFGGSKEQVTFYKACHVQLTRITSHPFLRNPP
jgi:GNAT superfamily N-acetyltransferase